MALNGVLCESLERLQPYRGAWDELAISLERPYCAPGWMLAWWDHMAPPDAVLRAVAVLADDGTLEGIAPFYASRTGAGLMRYAPLADSVSARVEPLARRGREEAVAAAVVAVLRRAQPRPELVSFAGIPQGSPWPGLLAQGWSRVGRASIYSEPPVAAPSVALGYTTPEEWLSGRSRNFRQQMRRSRRGLEQAGAVFRVTSTDAELRDDVRAFVRLHHARWENRGGSEALGEGSERMLESAGRELIGSGRFRLESIDVDGATISSQLFVAAGGELTYWLGGFDERYAKHRPALVALVEAVEGAIRRGAARLDLGPGAQDYKYRFADAEEQLVWVTLVPPGPRALRARLELLPRIVKWAISRRLDPRTKRLLRRLLRRSRSSEG